MTVRMCLDMPLSADAAARAEAIALAERADNMAVVPLRAARGIGRPRMAIRVDLRWRAGSEVGVRFIGGSAPLRRRVEAVAHRWEEYANIRFHFTRSGDAPVRVAFRRGGSWSYVGMAARSVPPPEATMNLGWLTTDSSDDELERVVLHEFGHALGCEHEHQSPGVRIPWDKPKVYAYYAGLGWPSAMVDEQVLLAHSPAAMQWSRFDPDSIMLYPVDEALTIGNWSVGWNRTLSDGDRAFIRAQYPFRARPAALLVPDGPPITASIGTPGELDRYRFQIAEPGRYALEAGGRASFVLSLHGPGSETALLAADDEADDGLARIERDLDPGTYTVHVRHLRSRGTGRYRLALNRR